MKIACTVRSVFISVGSLVFSSLVSASDELIVYVFYNGVPVVNASIALDGETFGTTGSDGSIHGVLDAGAHVVLAKGRDGDVGVSRFASNAGQLADVIIDLGVGASRVDLHSVTESLSERLGAQSGTIVVRVLRGGSPEAGVIVNFSGNGIGTTDANGIIEKELPRGSYRVSAEGVQRSVRSVGGIVRSVTLKLESQQIQVEMPTLELEEVFVMGTFDPSGFELSERDTAGVVDTIGVELLSRYSDSDVASSVIRVPGISVQDSKYIFIRGLGGRYVAATLNNSTMPSTNPSKRTVPLDLFPSSFVNQLDIKKTFLPYMPGESTGGNLVINTKTFPDEPVRGLSFGAGFLGGMTTEQVATDPLSGNFDVIGWDDGARERDVGVFGISQALGIGTVSDVDGNSYEINAAIEGELRRADDAAYIMRFKKGSAGFFHNVVVTVASDSATTFTHCASIEGGDSQGEVGNALYLNNWVYDCTNASDAQGLLVQADFDASAGTINAVAAEGNLGQFYESLSAEASGLDALDWTAINGSLPESVADVEYLDPTDFAGAVNPDQSDLWWAGWTIPGSL